jgi:hypothetical protein
MTVRETLREIEHGRRFIRRDPLLPWRQAMRSTHTPIVTA